MDGDGRWSGRPATLCSCMRWLQADRSALRLLIRAALAERWQPFSTFSRPVGRHGRVRKLWRAFGERLCGETTWGEERRGAKHVDEGTRYGVDACRELEASSLKPPDATKASPPSAMLLHDAARRRTTPHDARAAARGLAVDAGHAREVWRSLLRLLLGLAGCVRCRAFLA